MFEIGATLREARVRKRLTLQQVEEDTKIRIKYLQAIENEEFSVLPGATYARAFLRTYALYLGVDPHLVVEEYKSRYGQREEEKPLSSTASALRQRPSRRRSGLAFVALLAVLVLALVYILGLRSSHSSQPKVNPSTLHSHSASPNTSAHPSASSSTGATTGTANTSAVLLTASNGDTYVDIRRGSATGTPVYQGTLALGEAKTFTTKGTLAIIIGGDPANVTLTVNEKHVRTDGDTTGTVYLISKGKVTKQ